MDLYKKWLIKLLISFTFVLLILGLPILAINYIADPLWLFNHSNKYNDIQQGFNERQQKINKLTFSDEKYNALLIGSSRSTYINQHKFKDLKVFNLSVSSMYVEEYKDYIEYAKKRNGKPFEYIFLGLDFFAANKYRPESSNEHPEFYIDQANSYLYRLKMLASFDTLEMSIPVLKSSLKNKPVFVDHRYYDRENIASPFPVDDELRNKRIETNILQFFEKEEPYEYDPNIKKMLEDLVASNPKTKFIVYTTPVTASRLMIELEQEDYMEGYSQWLNDIVDTFGKVHHFMYLSEGATKLENFSDSHHFLPSFGDKVVDAIWNDQEENSPLKVVLTRDNVAAEIERTKEDLKNNRELAYKYLKPENADQPIYSDLPEAQPAFAFQSNEWDSQLAPLELLSKEGTFSVRNQPDGVRIEPQKAPQDASLQFGYDLAESELSKSGEEVTFIVSLKGKAAEPGAVQLFIQDHADGKWEQAAYNTRPDNEHYRSFKITKKIRPGTERIQIGLKWTNITNPNQWLQIEKTEIY